jgi:predicted N-acetyltransferase YhbS
MTCIVGINTGSKAICDGIYYFPEIVDKISEEVLKDFRLLFLDCDNEYFNGTQFRRDINKVPPITSIGISFVCFRNNSIVGYIVSNTAYGSSESFKYVYISQIYVKKELRNLGIGKKMIHNIIDFYEIASFHFLKLDTHERFGSSLEKTFGFERLGKVFFQMVRHKMIYLTSYALDLRKDIVCASEFVLNVDSAVDIVELKYADDSVTPETPSIKKPLPTTDMEIKAM